MKVDEKNPNIRIIDPSEKARLNSAGTGKTGSTRVGTANGVVSYMNKGP